MRKNQLLDEIEKRFLHEESKVVDVENEESRSGKYIRIFVALLMSIVIVGSLLYSLITSIK